MCNTYKNRLGPPGSIFTLSLSFCVLFFFSGGRDGGQLE